MIARRLGWPVTRCMAELSHREFLCWQARLQQEWNEPSLTDLYLMRLGQIIMASNGDKDATMEKVRLKFEEKKPLTEQQKQAITDTAKATWLARMGKRKGAARGDRNGTGAAGGQADRRRQQLHEDDGRRRESRQQDERRP